MKYIPRHTKSIEIEFTNKSNGLLSFRATFPYDNLKYKISRWYEMTKLAVANSEEVPVWQITGKHKIIESGETNRIIFEWPGGFAIDLPSDVSSMDYKIVLHYLEGLNMALTAPKP